MRRAIICSRTGAKHVISAYEGTFLVDPKTGDLTRLVVRTSQLPAEAGSCQATTTLDYNRVRLNDLDFLLPREAQLDIVDPNGAEFQNRNTYSAFRHQFLGESSLKFDDPPPIVGAPPAAKPFTLPAGIPFTVALTQSIDPRGGGGRRSKSKCKLKKAIRDASSHVLVPEGSEIMARIVKLEHFYGPPSSFTIGVKLETVNAGGSPQPLAATTSAADRRFEKTTGLVRRVPLGSFDALEDYSIEIFQFRDTARSRVVESGLESTWTTVEPSH